MYFKLSIIAFFVLWEDVNNNIEKSEEAWGMTRPRGRRLRYEIYPYSIVDWLIIARHNYSKSNGDTIRLYNGQEQQDVMW